ncbi:META domain-containing protein [Halovulum dunhuangense]|uniref:META domain-containing protein n=1 Tax=Halovulum dunhuangense TaxID=1505036 RepID=A0A849L529_9RHOB|nr:META domain-containing protein [Halovulum dunhuangense]NNU81548.1 META domain-containing protein [Halovulum dunhuangense]
MRPAIATLALCTLAACSPLPDTVGEAAPSDTLWTLESLNDGPAAFGATLRFTSDGRVTGSGPCNRFSARQTAPLPWFQIEDIAATRRACPDLAAEQVYFTALGAMEFAEVAADSLLLTNTDGESLFFRSAARPEDSKP